MDKSLYTIRRGEDHLPHLEVVDLQVHGGPRLRIPRAWAVEANLTAEQARQLEADGYDLKPIAGKRAAKKAAAAAAATDGGGDAAKE